MNIKDGSGHFQLITEPAVPDMANVTYSDKQPRDIAVRCLSDTIYSNVVDKFMMIVHGFILFRQKLLYSI